jgi:hypothetical protein
MGCNRALIRWTDCDGLPIACSLHVIPRRILVSSLAVDPRILWDAAHGRLTVELKRTCWIRISFYDVCH